MIVNSNIQGNGRLDFQMNGNCFIVPDISIVYCVIHIMRKLLQSIDKEKFPYKQDGRFCCDNGE